MTIAYIQKHLSYFTPCLFNGQICEFMTMLSYDSFMSCAQLLCYGDWE